MWSRRLRGSDLWALGLYGVYKDVYKGYPFKGPCKGTPKFVVLGEGCRVLSLQGPKGPRVGFKELGRCFFCLGGGGGVGC